MKIPTAAQRRAPCELDITSFRRGVFSIRDGWAAGRDFGWYRAAARRELERRIGAKKIQVGSVLIAATDTRGRERCRQDCASDYSGPVTLARKERTAATTAAKSGSGAQSHAKSGRPRSSTPHTVGVGWQLVQNGSLNGLKSSSWVQQASRPPPWSEHSRRSSLRHIRLESHRL